MFSFPNPVNERAARTVAAGVLLLCVVTIVSGWPWLLIPLTYGFWARVLTGPRLSPLGQLATRVVAPLIPGEPRRVPGPPKRFAQAIGVVFSTSALILAFGFGLTKAAWVVTGMLGSAAFLEAAFGICLGCKVFALLMRIGVIPGSVCLECADLSLRRVDPASLGGR